MPAILPCTIHACLAFSRASIKSIGSEPQHRVSNVLVAPLLDIQRVVYHCRTNEHFLLVYSSCFHFLYCSRISSFATSVITCKGRQLASPAQPLSTYRMRCDSQKVRRRSCDTVTPSAVFPLPPRATLTFIPSKEPFRLQRLPQAVEWIRVERASGTAVRARDGRFCEGSLVGLRKVWDDRRTVIHSRERLQRRVVSWRRTP